MADNSLGGKKLKTMTLFIRILPRYTFGLKGGRIKIGNKDNERYFIEEREGKREEGGRGSSELDRIEPEQTLVLL